MIHFRIKIFELCQWNMTTKKNISNEESWQLIIFFKLNILHMYVTRINLWPISNSLARIKLTKLFEWDIVDVSSLMSFWWQGKSLENSIRLLFIKIHPERILTSFIKVKEQKKKLRGIRWIISSLHWSKFLVHCSIKVIINRIRILYEEAFKWCHFNPETQAFLSSIMPSICLNYLNIFDMLFY